MLLLLYTRSTCSFCERAKALLEAHGVPFTEHSLDDDRALAAKLQARLGRPAMPYVMIDGELVGGLAELEELAAAGELGPRRA